MKDLITPLAQSEEFEKTFKLLDLPVRRIETRAGSCLIQTRKLPLIGALNLISRGPVLRDERELKPFLAEVRRAVRGPLVVNAGPGATRTGGLKVARGAKLAIIDIKPEDDARASLHQKWRNQLKKAEASPLTLLDQPLDQTKHAWFLEAERRQQKQRGYQNYPSPVLLAYAAANKGKARLVSAVIAGKPAAAMLVLRHGRMATYQAGVTTPLGRKHCAHNLILWRIIQEMRKKGVDQLDLGRADLSPGLQRFKLGAGARVEQLPGSYLFWNPLARAPRPRASLGGTPQKALN